MLALVTVLHDGTPLARSASDAATALLREAILDGRLAPGERLKEERLARELGISRTPVREALLLLQAEGLVDAAPNRGATVRTYEVADLDEVYELRALLEGFAARRAAGRVGAEALAALEASCARFEATHDLRTLVRENLLFHGTILDAAGSARLAATARRAIELPLVYRSFVWYSRDDRRASAACHRRIAAALAAGDGAAAEEEMRAHVLHARDLLVARVRAEAAT